MSMSECEASLEDALRRYGDMVPDDVAKAARALIREHRADDARAGRGGLMNESEKRLRNWMRALARKRTSAAHAEKHLDAALSAARDAALEEAAVRCDKRQRQLLGYGTPEDCLKAGEAKVLANDIRALKSAPATVCGEVSTVEGGLKLGANSVPEPDPLCARCGGSGVDPSPPPEPSTAEAFAAVQRLTESTGSAHARTIRTWVDDRAHVSAEAASVIRQALDALLAGIRNPLTLLEGRMGAQAKEMQRVADGLERMPNPGGHSGDEESGQHDEDCARCAWDAAQGMAEALRAALTNAPEVLPADRVREVLNHRLGVARALQSSQNEAAFAAAVTEERNLARLHAAQFQGAAEMAKVLAADLGLSLDAEEKTCAGCGHCESCVSAYQEEAEAREVGKTRLPGPRSASDRHRRDAAGCLPDCPACASADA